MDITYVLGFEFFACNYIQNGRQLIPGWFRVGFAGVLEGLSEEFSKFQAF